ncbi:head GIN domain-containing protein [Winogradskyella thalassocola]|uniref:Putative auto-transporter adhesin, head GIN domain n=1 Tax=Winogradskyella thalassocola TaxID=262004 RepID=A0A1G8IVL3_9FLAO|nr:head GIN domain-containing protein [Winogradskyella thalassocola]SDI22510.1 Putative auto-transporter adhesin, head GIN domain [Winogradskyella thalassocola]
MKLLKSITILTLLLSTTLASAQWGKSKKIKGDGNITTTTVSTDSYDDIKASGSMDFKLVKGTEGNISIKGDSNLMDYIVTEVKSNSLHIKIKDGYNLKPSETIVITIPYESISSVSLAGSGDVENSGTIKADTFKVALAGSGDINLTIDAEEIESKIAGSGDIKLKGVTSNLTTVVAGSGDFDGDALKSTNVDAKIAGSGDISVVCNGELNVAIAGSGDLKYSGKPTKKNTNISGSGSVSN